MPSLPEMIDSIQPFYNTNMTTKINDMSSGLFNMFSGMGQICGPLYSAFMTKHFGFK